MHGPDASRRPRASGSAYAADRGPRQLLIALHRHQVELLTLGELRQMHERDTNGGLDVAFMCYVQVGPWKRRERARCEPGSMARRRALCVRGRSGLRTLLEPSRSCV
jgi:hypothetical protein